jgi:c-di-GMP-binding flagellar brake protein YcgR
MIERREYFRIRTFARVSLRVLSEEEVEQARLRLKSCRPSAFLSSTAIDESGVLSEHRVALDLMLRIALTLDRIDRRLDEMARSGQSADGHVLSLQPVDITLSGSGFSGRFSLDVSPGELVGVQLDLWESGLPLIGALAHVVKLEESAEGHMITAFVFEEILPEDQERIIQLTLRSQSQAIRDNKRGEVR